ncbi:amidase [Pseudolysinimonas sp.]|uniref:amidase n=1 Tax=Pseudolysinimonas sp. TaxID=2680009 RepID=UPI003F7D1606
MASELHDLTALQQLDRLRHGEVSPGELVEHYLARIDRLDGELGAFVTVTPDPARERAAAVEALPHALALWGLPLGDKDLWRRAGVPTRFGSRLLADHVPEESDELVRVLDDAGAISLGKTNTPEFGLPSYTEPLANAPARVPYDTTLGAGGSSGGAAVAVAAGLLPAAPGSDGGGSIRIPAASTGLVGLKPSRGRVPAGAGFDSLGGFVVPGPIARTVTDAALLLDAMVDGGAYAWSTEAPAWDGGAYLNAAVHGEGRFQLGVTTDSPWSLAYDIRLEDAPRAALEVAIAELGAIGHGIEEFSLLPEEGYAPAFTTIWQGGASAIPVADEDLDRLEPLTAWLIRRGREVPGSQVVQALRWVAQYERRLIGQLAAYDAVLTPALAMTPRPLGWYDPEDAEENFAQQCRFTPYTSFVNATGLPAIVLPVSQTEDGIPLGVQLIGRPGGEHVLLAIGAQLEWRLQWHTRHPPQWDA